MRRRYLVFLLLVSPPIAVVAPLAWIAALNPVERLDAPLAGLLLAALVTAGRAAGAAARTAAGFALAGGLTAAVRTRP